MTSRKPVVLVILDGWGIAPASEGNAITQARLPHVAQYIKNYPVMTLHASGNEVGLQFGEMGNSEVGHLNIGAGRVYYQSLPRINQEINNGDFFKNQAFLEAVNRAKQRKSKLHLLGLLSPGNVHASTDHLMALLKLCQDNGLTKNVFIHVILDGRDCPYDAGYELVKNLQRELKKMKIGEIASLSGRYYAMDRDNRWDRIEKTYQVVTGAGTSPTSNSPLDAIKESYAQKVYDEEFVPTIITKYHKPIGIIEEQDAVVFFNFRPDRARQLTETFVLPGFNKFKRPYLKELFFVTMTEYDKDLPAVVAYPPVVIRNSLAEVVSKEGLRQLHVAETEKYAHITLFLNGTIEEPFPKEERVLVPSPRVSNYAQIPEMSAYGVSKEVIKGIEGKGYDFIAVNFANADMVGHTGDLSATIRACEVVDEAVGNIVDHTLAQGGVIVVTGDHGNAEEVINLQTGGIDKEHSTNPVPLLIIGKDFLGQAGPGGDPPEGDLSLLSPVGVLADVGPTVLKLLGIDQPPEMTGTALI